MNVTVDVDNRLLDEVRNRLGDISNKAPQAITSALNRAVTNVAANVSKETRKEYLIKAADIKATLSKTRASRSTMSAIVSSRSGAIPIDRFKVSPRTVQPKRKKPIKIAVKKGNLRESLGAFVSDINGIKVFKREGKKRLPIDRLFGPSVPQMIGNEEIRTKINQEGLDTFNRRLDHEINRLLDRVGSL
ncbi:phage tail protein [Niallia sp. 03190]|uniref:phage tail protein n=1 Tax=Niallia sp. 03190 TaxID=3458061 RepID=UPI004043C079